MGEPERIYSAEQLAGDGVSKKDLVNFLQCHASLSFQQEHKLKGQVKNVAKTRSKDQLTDAYNAMFEQKAFKQEGEDEAAAVAAAAKKQAEDLAAEAAKLDLKDKPAEAAVEEKPKYTKKILKKGDKTNFPRKGEVVGCYYTGKLPDGTIFDSNCVNLKRYKKPQLFKFKVGVGNVIRGWDEALMTMSAGEKVELIIEPEWAYGKKGVEGKIPPNTTLTFEVELKSID